MNTVVDFAMNNNEFKPPNFLFYFQIVVPENASLLKKIKLNNSVLSFQIALEFFLKKLGRQAEVKQITRGCDAKGCTQWRRRLFFGVVVFKVLFEPHPRF